MQNHKIPGGFESKLATQLKHKEGESKIFFKFIELKFGSTTRRPATDFAAVRTRILIELQHFMSERLMLNDLSAQITA